jgi:hypothetical protein
VVCELREDRSIAGVQDVARRGDEGVFAMEGDVARAPVADGAEEVLVQSGIVILSERTQRAGDGRIVVSEVVVLDEREQLLMRTLLAWVGAT